MVAKLVQDPQKLRELLNQAIQQGKNLLEYESSDAEVLRDGYESWNRRNEILLDSAFEAGGFLDPTPKSDYSDFRGLNYFMGTLNLDGEIDTGKLRSDIKVRSVRLIDIAKNIDIYPLKEREQMDSGARKDIQKNKAFIIHGQEELPRYMVLDLLRRATDVEPVVLVDQPNSGRTIIEKLEDSLGDSAAYAVVIMSADDVGGRRDGHQSPRARQNVVLELGYAMARLGRRNITVLHGQDVEIPSDIQGVAYYPLDDGSWQNRLLGDLKAAGFDVHFDRL